MFREIRSRAAVSGGCVSARRPVVTIALVAFSAIAMPAIAMAQNDSAVTVTNDSGVYSVAAIFTVAQPRSFAFAALTDYTQIPRFMPEVLTSTVLERAEDRAVVEQEAVARFMMFSKRLHLVLEVEEDRETIRFRDRSGKSFARYQGTWTIAEQHGKTHVTYELSATPSFDVPEFLLKRLLKRDASQMIERLKVEIETRARAQVN